MKKVLQGDVQHDVRVTALKGIGFGVRVFVNGELNQEGVAQSRDQIGPVARELLRFEDKCGNLSPFADAARHRLNGRDQALKAQDSA